MSVGSRLLAISDLHVGHADNRELVADLAPETDGDWLIVAGDVAERWPTSGGPCGCSPSGSPR